MMNILAFDLGTTSGWAALVNGRFEHGAQNFSPGKHQGGGMRGLRFERFITELLDSVRPGAVYFEKVRAHSNPGGGFNVDAAHIYGGLELILTMTCDKRMIPYLGLDVGVIKRTATGKGNASKEAMMTEAKRRGWQPHHGRGWDVKRTGDSDEADAMFILETGAIMNHGGGIAKLLAEYAAGPELLP